MTDEQKDVLRELKRRAMLDLQSYPPEYSLENGWETGIIAYEWAIEGFSADVAWEDSEHLSRTLDSKVRSVICTHGMKFIEEDSRIQMIWHQETDKMVVRYYTLILNALKAKWDTKHPVG